MWSHPIHPLLNINIFLKTLFIWFLRRTSTRITWKVIICWFWNPIRRIASILITANELRWRINLVLKLEIVLCVVVDLRMIVETEHCNIVPLRVCHLLGSRKLIENSKVFIELLPVYKLSFSWVATTDVSPLSLILLNYSFYSLFIGAILTQFIEQFLYPATSRQKIELW